METPPTPSQRIQPELLARPVSTHRISDNTLLFLLGGGIALFHILTNGQYGLHRDELDILMNARQLDWGYVAYPPFTPFIARIALAIFSSSLVGLRLFPAMAQGIVAVLVGLMAKDFGGGRLAQVTAVLAAAISPLALTAGTLIQYLSFDFLWWVFLSFCAVRLLRSEDPRWWLGIGAAIGLGMMNKYTMLFFVAGLAIGILFTPSRRYLRSPWLWAGAGLAILIFLPNLIWQIQHHFISLDFLSAIHARDIEWGRTNGYISEQLYVSTNPFLLPLWVAGLVFCFFAPGGKRFRPLAWMFVITFLLLLISRGRAYYLGPAYPMLIAAGSAWLDSWLHSKSTRAIRLGRVAIGALLFFGGVIAVFASKPIVPLDSPYLEMATEISPTSAEMIGWPDFVQEVANIYANLPAEEQSASAVLAANYGEAGALEFYGQDYNLPPIISGANSLWARGYGDPAPETVILTGFNGDYARRFFKTCKVAGRVSNRYGVKNEESSNHTSIQVCREPHHPWPEIWAEMQWFQ